MHTKGNHTLTSIPEKNECEEDKKWVPKNKHEVLKAKYKCLKKLFQIYDASVIGILPEQYAGGDIVEDSDEQSRKTRKRKRAHRTRTDACFGTSDHNIPPLQIESKTDTSVSDAEVCAHSPVDAYAATEESRESVVVSEHDYQQTNNMMYYQHPAPYRTDRSHRMIRERKRTRFQCFVQRLLGIRAPNPHHVMTNHMLTMSDNDINHRTVDRRRRRRLRFRRPRRMTRAQSESAVHGAPALLGCAQAVQRNCLLDTTPRQCPIAGCRMMFYGIINYNDHLNLCHFIERRYVCHFCHEGFERESDKLQHENEHIGLSHLAPPSPPTSRSKTAIVTQTEAEDVQKEKLKKIVSFFDKIVDSSQIITDIKKPSQLEINVRRSKTQTDAQTESSSNDGDSKHSSSCSCIMGKKFAYRGYSCNDLRRRRNYRSASSDVTSQSFSPKCNCCANNFEDRLGEFRSCGALPQAQRRPRRVRAHTEDGTINVTSVTSSAIGLDESSASLTQSDATCNCEGPMRKPSISIVYSASECSRNQSSRSLVDRFKSYKWEPCTRIIRV